MSTPTLDRPTQGPAPTPPPADKKRRGSGITSTLMAVIAVASFGFAITYDESDPTPTASSAVASVTTTDATAGSSAASPSAASPSATSPSAAVPAPETPATSEPSNYDESDSEPDVPTNKLPSLEEQQFGDGYLASLTGSKSTVPMQGPKREATSLPGTVVGETTYVTHPMTGERAKCSIGALATYRGQTVMITAGHCGPKVSEYTDADALGGSENPIGTSVKSESPGPGKYRHLMTTPDYTIVSTSSKVGGNFDARIGGKYTIAGLADPADITTDTEICKFGGSSGETCGMALGADERYIRAGAYSLGGDSGAPAFIKTGPSTVELVGFLSGSPGNSDYVSDFTFAKPIFEKYGLRVAQ